MGGATLLLVPAGGMAVVLGGVGGLEGGALGEGAAGGGSLCTRGGDVLEDATAEEGMDEGDGEGGGGSTRGLTFLSKGAVTEELDRLAVSRGAERTSRGDERTSETGRFFESTAAGCVTGLFPNMTDCKEF